MAFMTPTTSSAASYGPFPGGGTTGAGGIGATGMSPGLMAILSQMGLGGMSAGRGPITGAPIRAPQPAPGPANGSFTAPGTGRAPIVPGQGVTTPPGMMHPGMAPAGAQTGAGATNPLAGMHPAVMQFLQMILPMLMGGNMGGARGPQMSPGAGGPGM